MHVFARVRHGVVDSHRRDAAVLTVLLLLAGACETPTSVPPWSTDDPANHRLDPLRLAALVAAIDSGDYGDLHGLLIARDGVIVLEHYFRGYTDSTLHPVWSVTKSVTSALVGVALADGRLRSLDERVLQYYAQYPSIAHRSAWKEAITLEHLLTMTCGLEWDESSLPYSDPQNSVHALIESGDWLRYALDLPMADAPGTRFVYSSACSMLLSGIIEHATGRTVEDYAAEHLFDPLGIVSWYWEPTPRGHSATAWGLHLRPRDMLRFGLLFLRHGTLDGRRVLSAEWVSGSTARHADVPGSGYTYGYQWWRLPPAFRGAGGELLGEVFVAWGWGDQLVIVLPLYDLVVVTTGGNYDTAYENAPVSFLLSHIVPAISDAERPPATGAQPVSPPPVISANPTTVPHGARTKISRAP